jgi:hypothetical protein
MCQFHFEYSFVLSCFILVGLPFKLLFEKFDLGLYMPILFLQLVSDIRLMPGLVLLRTDVFILILDPRWIISFLSVLIDQLQTIGFTRFWQFELFCLFCFIRWCSFGQFFMFWFAATHRPKWMRSWDVWSLQGSRRRQYSRRCNLRDAKRNVWWLAKSENSLSFGVRGAYH